MFNSIKKSCQSVVVAAAFGSACVGVVLGDITGPPLAVQAENVSGVAVFELNPNDLSWDPQSETWMWTLAAPMVLTDSGTGQPVALLTNGRISYGVAPRARSTIDIGIAAGPTDTAVRIISPLITFPVMSEDYAAVRASASITVTDADINTAWVVGEGGNGRGIYRSYYNGDLENGTSFSELVSFVFASAGATVTGTQNDPPVGYRPVYEDVDSLAAVLAFTVSHNDLAVVRSYVGTSTPPPCFGDLDSDRVIGLNDLTIMLSSFGACAGDDYYNVAADLEEDGCVDLADLGILLSVFASACP